MSFDRFIEPGDSSCSNEYTGQKALPAEIPKHFIIWVLVLAVLNTFFY
jgi:hypothetical protein